VDSYGASYDTILHQIGDFFKGFNSLVDFGKDPTLTKLGDKTLLLMYSSERVTEMSDDLFVVRRLWNIKSEQLYFRVGTVDE
jgi:hypothetical protein